METSFLVELLPRTLRTLALSLLLSGCAAAPSDAPKSHSASEAPVLRDWPSAFLEHLSVTITPDRTRGLPGQEIPVTIAVSNPGSDAGLVPVALVDYFRLGFRSRVVADEPLPGQALLTTILEPPEHPGPITCRELGAGKSIVVVTTIPAPDRPGQYELFTIWSTVAPVPFEVVE